jgi:hypothetical protein
MNIEYEPYYTDGHASRQGLEYGGYGGRLKLLK